ncbi:MAG: sulfite exporter TauE/SafE family protein, partial [Microthrixaceae bacterium]
MRALLASPLGFLVGVSLGALGGGGSILAVPVLVYAAGQDATSATATSLFLVGSASLVGMGAHWRAGRVKVGAGLLFGLSGIGGSVAGSLLNRHVDADVLLLAFSGLVVLAAWRMLTACPTCTKVGENRTIDGPGTTVVRTGPRVDVRTAALVLTTGTAVGFLTGLIGVGGGFVIVPALALALKLPMPQAI